MRQTLLIAACIVAGATAGIQGISRLYYGRSARATLCEWGLRLMKKTPTEDRALMELIAKSHYPEPRNTLPRLVRPNQPFTHEVYEGMELYTLNPEGTGPVVLYLHGGAYIHNVMSPQMSMINQIMDTSDCTVIMPLYRLAPWGNYHDTYQALISLYQRMHTEMRQTAQKRDVVVLGDSAGGGLAVGLCAHLCELQITPPDRLLLLSPWLDALLSGENIEYFDRIDPLLCASSLRADAQVWAGGKDPGEWEISPQSLNLSGLDLPPVTMWVGTRELFYPQCSEFAERLSAAGKEIALIEGIGQNHVYPAYPTPEGHEACQQIARVVAGYEPIIERSKATKDYGYITLPRPA